MDYTHLENSPYPKVLRPAPVGTDGFHVKLSEIDTPSTLEQAWRALELRSHSSFFLSWDWIGRWLTLMAADLRPQLLQITHGEVPVGLAILVARSGRKHHVLPCRRWYLHETGDPRHDQLRIEYNGLLADARFGAEVAQAALQFLARQDPWDEICLSGIHPESGLLSPPSKVNAAVHSQQAAHFVDLNALKAAGQDYLSALSANTRSQIRRALRDAAKLGDIVVTRARDVDQAMTFFAELKRLHQLYWTQKAQPGAFANPIFTQFHDDLVRQCTASGQVQLIRVAAGSHTFGYLYNFVHRGRIYNYQSGFDYRDARLKPGIISHYQAIQYNLAQGAAVYDFLGGNSRYKQSLSTHTTPLVWAALGRKGMRGFIYQAVEKTLPAIRRLRLAMPTSRTVQPGRS